MNKMYFAQPLFRAASPDFKHLANLPAQFTIDTPGGSLAGAIQYYTIEAYGRETDRDAACGMTAHPDIKFVPIAAVPAAEIDQIGCGYAINHPLFEKILDPIFSGSIERLIDNIRCAGRSADGPIAMESMSIARTRYIIEAIADRGHLKFGIEGVAVFERDDRRTINATCAFLKDRLNLHLSPTLPKRRAH